MILASPPFWMLPATVLAALAYGLPALAGERLSHTHARRMLGVAWAAHAVALLSLLVGPVHFGFAPAISVTAWLVVSAYILESQFFPKFKARWAMGSLGAIAVVLAWFFPGTPLSAQASAWLPLHAAPPSCAIMGAPCLGVRFSKGSCLGGNVCTWGVRPAGSTAPRRCGEVS